MARRQRHRKELLENTSSFFNASRLIAHGRAPMSNFCADEEVKAVLHGRP
jgi:hypothetical protein